ncbi:MAG TPA: helix-turn-helix transcriptional regulator, partial [Anaeromyxobacteraceae bacterium]|nr:helix-turn-helix transcriptional regulator [Anaeromyxobacteraceae bacterium]
AAEPAAAAATPEESGKAAEPPSATPEAAKPPAAAVEAGEASAPSAPAVATPAPAPAPAPILLDREVVAEPPHRELPIIEGAIWTGEALRKVRESRGLSVRELCDRTKITRYHLENIEAERFSLLPAAVYLRGILVAVARELRLDGQKVARSYLERMSGAGADPERSR